MLEFLSDAGWLNPQIDFLLMLQTLRIEHFSFLDTAFLSITILGELWLPVIICSIVYWCIDTKSGMYLFLLFTMQLFVIQTLKMLACVYRPWILSSKIHPVEAAVPAAKGYSFPSGHSGTASSVLGGLAYCYKKNIPLCIFLILLILCTGFSRMWLGVHTPQDVVIGLFTGAVLVFAFKPLADAAEKNKDIYLYFLAAADILSAAALIFICFFKKYPVDYIDGQLLVNPYYSVYAADCCFGFAAGLLNGAVLCRRYIDFDASKGSLREKIIRGIIGVFAVFVLVKGAGGFVFSNTLSLLNAFLIMAFSGFFITFIYPFAVLLIQKKLNSPQKADSNKED